MSGQGFFRLSGGPSAQLVLRGTRHTMPSSSIAAKTWRYWQRPAGVRRRSPISPSKTTRDDLSMVHACQVCAPCQRRPPRECGRIEREECPRGKKLFRNSPLPRPRRGAEHRKIRAIKPLGVPLPTLSPAGTMCQDPPRARSRADQSGLGCKTGTPACHGISPALPPANNGQVPPLAC